MKQITRLLFIILISSTFKPGYTATLPQPEVIQINDRVFAILGPAELPNKTNRGYMVNSTAIIGDTGVILIDTGFTDEIGRHIKATVASITDKPITHIINTHDHGDHTLGNSVFDNAMIISSEKCQKIAEQSGYEWIGLVENMTGLAFPNTRPVAATTTYTEGRTEVTLQGIRMVMWIPEGSHTNNDLMVILPDDKVLVSGDIVVNTIMPNFRDGNVRNWISTLNQISQMPVSTIIPGHGKLTKPHDVKKMHDAMKKLYAGVEEGYQKGLMDSEIRNTLDLSYWKKQTYFDELMGGNINRIYLEVEEEQF
jgi:cyclase